VEDVIAHSHEPSLQEPPSTSMSSTFARVFGLSSKTPSAKDQGMGQGKLTAVVHVGADLLLRTAYCPDKFSHRFRVRFRVRLRLGLKLGICG
jgi:hypothetical protein